MLLSENVSEVKGVGEKTVPKLNKLNIYTIRDLIYDLPRGFMKFESTVVPDRAMVGKMIAFRGIYVPGSSYMIKKGRHMTFAKVKCQDVVINLTYFNAPYIKKSLETTEERVFYGILRENNKGLSMTQAKVFSITEYEALIDILQPIYSLTKGISNNQLTKYIKNAFGEVELPGEYLTEDELTRMEMPHFQKALTDIHFPINEADHSKARKRLAFHEFLVFLLETRTDETISQRPFGESIIPVADTNRLIEALPYRLTDAQMRTWHEIEDDMCADICMNRMVQGDVGSGKTIIAFLALLLNAANGHQGVLMAPTEVLAKQHFEGLSELARQYNLPLKINLLIGAMSAKEKRSVYENLSTGYTNVVIGTHALIQENVEYRDLTLAITDEQHRFGVKQREAIASKNSDVHILVMSATPIPRSLAMTLYSGIKLSVIDELPANRLPIKNCVIKQKSRVTAYKFIADEIAKGHQAYVICPLVEPTEGLEYLENVEEYAETLRLVLPQGTRVDYLHGKMKLGAKNAIMDEFAAHNIDVLVSTTVIEVGINVPNATVMMVENADRFGLATLHQLRGRVGRGEAQSYCIFINTSASESSQARLEILNNSNDGFYIAEQDLKMRGPGEVTGVRQSGDFGFEIADIYDDSTALEEAKNYLDMLSQSENISRLHEISDSVEEFGFNAVDIRTI